MGKDKLLAGPLGAPYGGRMRPTNDAATGGPTPKEEVISYERLYRLWEENNWSATKIDFSVDKDHWHSRLTAKQREAALWTYAMFLVGEEAVARTLTPVLDAASEYPQSIFLTTQIVDEARHHVFFDRFMREVAAQGHDIRSTLAAVEDQLTWGFKQVFDGLDRVTSALRRKPNEKPLLA
jgi:ribonucleotide reductase beta subunit family protein with ferritin-like domain